MFEIGFSLKSFYLQKKYEMALKLAKLAVTFAPSEYNTWSKLTEVYIYLEDYNSVCFKNHGLFFINRI